MPVTTVVLMRCWGRVRRRFDFDPSRKVWGYSKGNRQKINLIAALASRAGLLILDEPTAGLDPLMEQAFRESVLEARGNGRRCSCPRTSCPKREVLCDRIAILRGGRLVEIGTLAAPSGPARRGAWYSGCTRTTTRGV